MTNKTAYIANMMSTTAANADKLKEIGVSINLIVIAYKALCCGKDFLNIVFEVAILILNFFI